MIESKKQLEEHTKPIIEALGDMHKWQWEPERKSLLSTFSRDKISDTLSVLHQEFPHQWDKKSAKKITSKLKAEMGDLFKLLEGQLLFTKPADEQTPTILAIWWPWGHGGTVSLRLMLLSESYIPPEPRETKDSFFTVVKKLFSKNERV